MSRRLQELEKRCAVLTVYGGETEALAAFNILKCTTTTYESKHETVFLWLSGRALS